jgi:hypothetical protein
MKIADEGTQMSTITPKITLIMITLTNTTAGTAEADMTLMKRMTTVANLLHVTAGLFHLLVKARLQAPNEETSKVIVNFG